MQKYVARLYRKNTLMKPSGYAMSIVHFSWLTSKKPVPQKDER